MTTNERMQSGADPWSAADAHAGLLLVFVDAIDSV